MPGQFWDYRWPGVIAGYDLINVDAADPRAGYPTDDGGRVNVRGDWREQESSHWWHDHMFDFTAHNVYKGSAGVMNYYSSVDRGNECIQDGVNFGFASGCGLGWGNRDYDVNLAVGDKAWDPTGQLWFNPFNVNGFIGDQMTVNLLWKPVLPVRARKYRFRILDASVSRNMAFAFIREHADRWEIIPAYMIANDGNLMEHAVLFDQDALPTQGIGERYDVIIDFSPFAPGTELYLVNVIEHKDGKKINARLTVDQARLYDNSLMPGGVGYNGDPCIGKVMKFVVNEYNGVDQSADPAQFLEGGRQIIPVVRPTREELANAVHHTFDYAHNGGFANGLKPWLVGVNGNGAIDADMRRVSEAQPSDGNNLVVWTIKSGGGWSHPIHAHFEEVSLESSPKMKTHILH